VCGVCGKISENSLCKKCEKLLREQEKFVVQDYSDDEEMFFNEHMYVFPYEGIIRKVILSYKFRDKAYLYKTFTNFLLKNSKFVENIKCYDIIIAVPVSKERKKERGYNQSALIAKDIAKATNIRVVTNVLYKEKNIAPQSTLNKEERGTNIKGAFKLYNANIIKNKNIILVDDIYTTGSTVNECSKLLKEAGATKIGILTLAKD
jgi:ComF family protein